MATGSPFLGYFKMFKYLISDMDHTLLQEDGQLDSATIQAVRQSPLQLCLASARNPYSMIDFTQQLRLTGPQLAMNGAIIFKVVDHQVQILEERMITKDTAGDIEERLGDRFPEVDFTWITRDHWYIPRMTPQMKVEMQYSGVQPVLGKHLADTASPCQIVLIIKDPERFMAVQSYLQSQFRNLGIRSSGDGYLTINAAGASKGTLVDYLIRQGVQRSAIVGVGDDQNDLPLLQTVGYSLAVANAAPNVRQVVDQVIPSNQEDGIAKFIQQFKREFDWN